MWRMLRSDWVVLPAVAIATAAACLGGLELAARLTLPEQLAETCQTPTGAFRAGCAFRMKAAEGPWTEVAFNACGSRSAHPCDALPADNRVVVIGSSISRGYAVRYQAMFAPHAEQILDRACSTAVEFQNLSVRWPTTPASPAWASALAAARQASSLHPKAVLLFVTPWDLSQYHDKDGGAAPQRRGIKATAVYRALAGVNERIRQAREDSRLVLAMRHFLNREDQVYVDSYLKKGDETAYLKRAFPAEWDSRIAMVARFAAPIAAQAERAGASFSVVYLPLEPDVLLARRSAAEADTDPMSLPRKLGEASAAHGWKFIDALPAFTAPGAPRLAFYRINGHPNALGHAAIGRAIADALRSDPGLCAPGGASFRGGPAAGTPISDTGEVTPVLSR